MCVSPLCASSSRTGPSLWPPLCTSWPFWYLMVFLPHSPPHGHPSSPPPPPPPPNNLTFQKEKTWCLYRQDIQYLYAFLALLQVPTAVSRPIFFTFMAYFYPSDDPVGVPVHCRLRARATALSPSEDGGACTSQDGVARDRNQSALIQSHCRCQSLCISKVRSLGGQELSPPAAA